MRSPLAVRRFLRNSQDIRGHLRQQLAGHAPLSPFSSPESHAALVLSRWTLGRFHPELEGWAADPGDRLRSPSFEATLNAILDDFEWSLHELPSQQGGDDRRITPDRWAMIFEQTCAGRTSGTFYTPHDVTEYICVNTILPKLSIGMSGPTSVADTLAASSRYGPRISDALKWLSKELEGIVDADHLISIWQGIHSIRVLDPTCGAGAFLVSAFQLLHGSVLRIVERLAGVLDGDIPPRIEESSFASLRALLLAASQTRSTMIAENVVAGNLFGVDLLPEATEVCRMRLLLTRYQLANQSPSSRLMQALSKNTQTGNTFVGLPSKRRLDELQRSSISQGDSTVHFDVDTAYAKQYFRDEPAFPHNCESSHRHFFHYPLMFAEPYLSDGEGFDVVIGNPPFVEVSELETKYPLPESEVRSTGNLYSLFVERAGELLAKQGSLGAILPMSAVSTPRMYPLMTYIHSHFEAVSLAHFAVRPGKIFDGVDMNVSVLIAAGRTERATPGATVQTTSYIRWHERVRAKLFENLHFHPTALDHGRKSFPKVGSIREASILNKLARFDPLQMVFDANVDSRLLYYHSGGRYFRKCLFEKHSKEYKPISVQPQAANSVLCLLSSSLFYWYWIVISDCYHVTRRDVHLFPYPSTLPKDLAFDNLAERLLADLERNAVRRTRVRSDGSEQIECNYRMAFSRPILDEIDGRLAEHYGLDAAEMRWILDFDQAFRHPKSNPSKLLDQTDQG